MKRILVLAAAVLLVAGCSTTPTPIDATVSAELQAGVVEIADASAAGDYDAGLARLDDLQAQLETAIDEGGVTAQAAVAIQAAIDAVRSDLVTLATPEPEPDPEPTPVEPAKPGKGDKPGKPEKPGKNK